MNNQFMFCDYCDRQTIHNKAACAVCGYDDSPGHQAKYGMIPAIKAQRDLLNTGIIRGIYA